MKTILTVLFISSICIFLSCDAISEEDFHKEYYHKHDTLNQLFGLTVLRDRDSTLFDHQKKTFNNKEVKYIEPMLEAKNENLKTLYCESDSSDLDFNVIDSIKGDYQLILLDEIDGDTLFHYRLQTDLIYWAETAKGYHIWIMKGLQQSYSSSHGFKMNSTPCIRYYFDEFRSDGEMLSQMLIDVEIAKGRKSFHMFLEKTIGGGTINYNAIDWNPITSGHFKEHLGLDNFKFKVVNSLPFDKRK